VAASTGEFLRAGADLPRGRWRRPAGPDRARHPIVLRA
jgi:hypothetical protein